jgi:hypothetical protein
MKLALERRDMDAGSWYENQKERNHVEDQAAYRIILKWVLKK